MAVVREKDVLYHYGVLGMKWGVRKDRPREAYAKATKKLKKFDEKEIKYTAKSNKHASKGTGFTEIARSHRIRSGNYNAKAHKYKRKGQKWVNKMERVFEDVSPKKLNKEDRVYVESYINRMMKNKR